MINEYVAIFLVPLLLWLFLPMKLGLPFGYYSSIPNLLSTNTKDFNFAGLYRSFLIQLIAEILVDTFCCTFEGVANKGISIRYIYYEQYREKRWALFLFVTSSCCFGHIFTFLFVFLRNSYSNCVDMNICCCAEGRGLQEGGLVERYCGNTIQNITAFVTQNCE